jgi:hypothetical protein
MCFSFYLYTVVCCFCSVTRQQKLPQFLSLTCTTHSKNKGVCGKRVVNFGVTLNWMKFTASELAYLSGMHTRLEAVSV